MQKVVFLIACLLFVMPVGAQADWKTRYPDLQEVGTGILKVFFMDIYSLTLHSSERNYKLVTILRSNLTTKNRYQRRQLSTHQ